MDYEGYKILELSDEDLSKLYSGTYKNNDFVENEYLIAQHNGEIKDYFQFTNGGFVKLKFPRLGTDFTGILKPRNPQQFCAMSLIKNDNIPVKLITGHFGSGKAQPVSTIIPTPDGYKKLGDIKVGDYVFDRKGKPTKVLGVYPQGMIDNYKVTFKDGRISYCNDEHIWSCYTSKRNLKNVTIREMLNTGIKTDSGQYRYRIPLSASVEYSKKYFEIDPYVMGCFLGDGNCLENSLSISSSDEELVSTISALIGAERYKREHKNNYTWIFYFKECDKKKYSLNYKSKNSRRISTRAFFRNYPELINYAKDKHIPQEYLFGDTEQRLNLLQGLLDTNGTIEPFKGRIRFTTTSPQLKEDVKQLVWSLGFLCEESIDSCLDDIDKNVCYNLSISAPADKKPLLFRLIRKKKIAVENLYKRKRTHGVSLTIKNIEKMPEQEEMVCIYVDNNEHLFLTNDYIVTHNTVSCINGALEAIRDGKVDKIIFVRNNVQVKDTEQIGALPGSEWDKTLPFLMPFCDHCGGIDGVKELVMRNQLEVIPLGFLRGRSIKNAILYSMESENLTKEHIQLILGRIDEGSQLWMDGDLKQRDKTVFEKSKGLEIMIEKLKGNKLFGYVHLIKSERSEIARLSDLLD